MPDQQQVLHEKLRAENEGQALLLGSIREDRDLAWARIDLLKKECGGEYYRGVAEAMDLIRAYDFPLTERVDYIADRLAPPSDSEDGGSKP